MSGHSLDPTQVLNPTTPMAFVSPEIASQLTIVTCISAGCAAVFLWDVWDNICGDYRLIAEFDICLPTVVYFLSRFATMYFVLSYVVFNTAAIIWDCSQFEKAVSTGFPIAIDATSFLFLLRVRAIFNRDKTVVAFFSFLWLTVVISSLTGPFGISGTNIGPTQYCIFYDFKSYVDAAAVVPLFYDTMVFVAISRRLMVDFLIVDHDIRTVSSIKALVFGDYLPVLARSLLQDGQVYYLTTITTGLTGVLLLFVPGVPSHILRTMLTVPNVTLMNIMACRVFRKTKFGLLRETSIATSVIFQGLEENLTAGSSTPVSEATSTPVGSTTKLQEV
ncbi:hypothetical protein BJ165DRAFT_1372806 [Panaeolus papilionaceus]|nr:hypothetical protein BJ165DRAFT_1372806 [Panaeolus papilionaceus]